jgi:hypothetical protein
MLKDLHIRYGKFGNVRRGCGRWRFRLRVLGALPEFSFDSAFAHGGHEVLVLILEHFVHVLFGEAELFGLFRVGVGAFADTPAFQEYQRLQHEFVLSSFALHVVHGVSEFDVGIEAEDHERTLGKFWS